MASLDIKKAIRQFALYSSVGLLTNIVLFILYLFFTYLGSAPKLTMTALYIGGVFMSFIANRRFTFTQIGNLRMSLRRYLLTHLIGYMLNLSFLFLFVDWLGVAHQLVQAIAIVVISILLFFICRNFVFFPIESTTRGTK